MNCYANPPKNYDHFRTIRLRKLLWCGAVKSAGFLQSIKRRIEWPVMGLFVVAVVAGLGLIGGLRSFYVWVAR